MILSRPGSLVIFVDFNVIKNQEEIFNSHFYHSTTFEFNIFIHGYGLLDLNIGGRNFTYLCEDGFKLCKLDKFLVCPNFFNNFPTASVTVLPCEYSDHSPIILQIALLDFDLTPFQFFNSWLFRDGLL